jgi:hypothetical protein
MQALEVKVEENDECGTQSGNRRRATMPWKVLLPAIASLAIGSFVITGVRAPEALVARGKWLH